jgi:vacuolar-type H+-ATPase catalytic subunit A/Vma1
MSSMSDYADRIREIIQEAENDLLEFGIECSYPCGVSHFVIRDGGDDEVIW